MRALENIFVVDLTRVMAGPLATMFLADLGATVWKIEGLEGDGTRTWGSKGADWESHYFVAGNRGKKSIAVNLKDPRGPRLVARLARKADIFAENFKTGDMKRFGLDYDALRAANERLIYLSLTGFGQTGPRAKQLGYDTVIQGMSGIMSVTGEPDRPPGKVGIAWVDVMAGLTATIGLMTALFVRERTDVGQHIDISLYDVAMMALIDAGQDYLQNHNVQGRTGSVHRNFAPSEPFLCSDGWITLAVGDNEQFARLCRAMGLESLLDDPLYATNATRLQHRETLAGRLAPVFASRSREDWVAIFENAKVPLSPIFDIAEALVDPQIAARNILWETNHPLIGQLRMLANPLQHMSLSPARLSTPPPLLGEHSAEVLQEALDLRGDEFETLVTEGVVRLRSEPVSQRA